MSLARKISTLLGSAGEVINPSVGGTPAGVVLQYAGATAPTGWLLCYGQSVSRTTYAALFAVIGTTLGVGDGSTTFGLPDLRGRVVAGNDNMGGSAAGRITSAGAGFDGAVLGATGGAQTHQLTVAQMPGHSHSGSATSAGGHAHALPVGSSYGVIPESGGSYGSIAGITAGTTESSGAHTHAVTTVSQGGDQVHPIVQPTIMLNAIIKT